MLIIFYLISLNIFGIIDIIINIIIFYNHYNVLRSMHMIYFKNKKKKLAYHLY